MPRLSFICTAALLAMYLFPNAARSQTFVADFNNAALDPNLSVYSTNSQISVTSGGGELIFSMPFEASPLDGQASVFTKFATTGNFTMSVDVNYTKANILDLAVVNANFGPNIAAEAAYYNNGVPYVQGSFFLNGSAGGTLASANFSPVQLEIVRAGGTMTEYAGPIGGGTFEELNSYTNSSVLSPASFSIGLNNYGSSSGPSEAIFSNFIITPGALYPPTVRPFGGTVQYDFNFPVIPGTLYAIDPTMAQGFLYQVGAGNPNFGSFELPNTGNIGPYALYLWNGSEWTFKTDLAPNTLYNFGSGGVDQFEIRDIDPGVNPSSGTSFVTKVSFVSDGTFDGSMTALVVPEPSTWALMVVGFVGLGLAAIARRAPGGITTISKLAAEAALERPFSIAV